MQGENSATIRVRGEFADMDLGPDLGDWETVRLLSKENTARVLGGITIREVEKRINERDLEAVNIGKRRLVTRESIDAYVERLRAREAEKRARAQAAV